MSKKKEKPTLIEQSHSTWLAMIRAKRRGDQKEVDRLKALHDWLAEHIRKGEE